MSKSLRVVLTLLGLCLFAYGVTGKVIYTRLIYIWLLLLVTGWFWSRKSLQNVKFTRSSQVRRTRVGEMFGENYEIRNSGRLPVLWLEVRNEAELPGITESRVLAWIRGNQQRSYRSQGRLIKRGVFQLGPTTILSGDLFGLFRVSKRFPAEGSLLVYPPMVDIRDFPKPPGFQTGGEALRRKTHQITPNAAGVREYAPGDAISRIHWMSTARRDQLMVKEFELDPKAEVWIFLDSAKSVQFAQSVQTSSQRNWLWETRENTDLYPSTDEYGVSIAASLARYYLQNDRAVGLVSNARSVEVLTPDRGGRQLEKILELLALLDADGDLSLPALVTTEAQHVPRGSTVILISPSVDNQIITSLDQLLRLGLHPVVVLIEADSFGGPEGTSHLIEIVKSMNLPVYSIKNGVSLGNSLINDQYTNF